MNVKRKTVRFQDNLSDLAVYDAITDYKKYGYRSESHMVIEAVSEDYEQLGYFTASLTAEGALNNVQYNQSTKVDSLVQVTIEGDLP